MREEADHSGAFLLAVYLFLLVFGIFLLLAFTRSELFFLVNNHHSPFADILFKTVTFFGDGILYALVILILLHVQFKYAIHAASAFLASSLTAQLMKRVLFRGTPRPKAYFDGIQDIYFVPGVEVHSWGSFPSGHTMTAFSLAVLLTLIVKDKRWGFLFLILALLAAYSRIYLALHFYEDVLAGFMIGTTVTLASWQILEHSAWSHKSWWHKGRLKFQRYDQGTSRGLYTD